VKAFELRVPTQHGVCASSSGFKIERAGDLNQAGIVAAD
jgi:hypothetical protein